MSEIGATMTRDYTGTLCNSLEYEITTQEHGRLRICLHHYNDSKMTHWVSGYLADFAEEFPKHWHGFDHRKQNFHCGSEHADIFLDYFRRHLKRFGICSEFVNP